MSQVGRNAGIPFTPADRQSALAKLMDFAMRPEFDEDRLLATAAFWSPWFDARGEEDGRRAMALPESVGAFSTWFALDFHLASGATLVQLLLRRRTVSLGRGEGEYLDRMREAHLCPTR